MGHDLPLNSPLDIISYYLDSFNTNYIIFRNVEIFKKNKILHLNEEFEGKYRIFKICLFVEMETSSKLINLLNKHMLKIPRYYYSVERIQSTVEMLYGRLLIANHWINH
jgi:hypothetical protein